MNSNPNQGHKYKKDIADRVISSIKNANNLSDIHWVLRNARANFNFNLYDFRDENGENTLHLLAKYAPRALKKHAFTRDGLKLMNTPDNDGRYPLDYFFCFSSSEVLKKDMQKIASAIEKFKLKKPNWLEVKMLIVENQATYSAVDSVPMDMWQQETPEEFKACLKTERGQKFIKMATNYKYKGTLPPMYKNNSHFKFDNIYYGMEINRYTNSNSEADEFSFFRAADTGVEIELSLLQLATQIFSVKSEISPMPVLFNQFAVLLERVIKSDSNVIELKEKILSSVDRWRDTNEHFLCNKFSVWENLEIIAERNRLLSIVDKDNHRQRHQITNQSVL